jgi:hypothetical protein
MEKVLHSFYGAEDATDVMAAVPSLLFNTNIF